MSPRRIVLSWSSGKDSAWALQRLRGEASLEVVALLTTVNETRDRVAMHAVRRELLEAQAAAVGLPLWIAPIPDPCSNEQYASAMRRVVDRALAEGVEAMAFGDLFLEDIRAYRETQLADTGLGVLFPLWGCDTHELAREMLDAGVKAHVACIDPGKLPLESVGQPWDRAWIDALPEGVDPCGEHGEFHTFVHDGPMFDRPVEIRTGERVERDGFAWCDLLPASTAGTTKALDESP
jgi:uncharacterized protein (TIGR00290 family)